MNESSSTALDIPRPRMAHVPVDPPAPPPAPVFDFRYLRSIIRRRLPLIGLITLAAAAIAYLVSEMTPQSYTARASILLDTPSVNAFGSDEVFGAMGTSSPVVESQIQLLRSPYLLSEVVNRLGLDERDDFMNPPQTELGALVSEWMPRFGAAEEAIEVAPTSADRFQLAIEQLRSNLSVTRSGLTLVLDISYSSTDPELSAEIANGVAAAYIDGQRSNRQNTAGRAAEWFDERMAELNLRAIEAEQQIAAFQTGSRVRLQDEIRLNALRGDLQDTVSARLEARDRLRGLTSGGFEATEADIAAARDALGEAEVAEAAAREAFRAAITGSDEAGSVASPQIRLRSLESEARIYRQLHDSYLESYLRMIQQQSFPSADALVISKATTPRYPSGFGTKRMMILAGALGLSLGLGAAFLRESGDRRLYTRERFASAIKAPVLGILPPKRYLRRSGLRGAGRLRIRMLHRLRPTEDISERVPGSPRRLSLAKIPPLMRATAEYPLSVYSETMRRTKVAIDQRVAGTVSMVGFVSAETDIGRSIAAFNYAQMLALGGARTLLIDLDWNAAQLTRAVTPTAKRGLADLTAEQPAPITEADLWFDERTGMAFLPNRSLARDVALDPAVFDVDRLRLLLSRERSFEHIVLDLPHLTQSAEAAALSDLITGFVVVARWGRTDTVVLDRAIEQSGMPRGKIAGGVLDGATARRLRRYGATG